jgi:nucleotide-binding universal stress UspA family protein
VPSERDEPLGRTVVVPVANPDSATALIRFAALIAGPDSGSVVPVNVLGFDASRTQVEEHRRLTEGAETVALRHGAEARSVVRVDASPTAGILHTIVEQGATSMLVGWKGTTDRREGFFGSVIDQLVNQTPVPVAVCHPGEDEDVDRVILSVTHHDLSTAGEPGLRLAVALAGRMAGQAEVPLLVITEDEPETVREHLPQERRERTEIVVDARRQPIALRHQTVPGDVVVMGVPPTSGRLDNRAIRVGRAIRDRTVIVAVPR